MTKKLNMRRRQIALPPALDAYLTQLATERGVEASEIMREAFFEYKDRREKFVPRQSRRRNTTANSQPSMALMEQT